MLGNPVAYQELKRDLAVQLLGLPEQDDRVHQTLLTILAVDLQMNDEKTATNHIVVPDTVGCSLRGVTFAAAILHSNKVHDWSV
jgi:hypothetical protein